MIGRGTVLRLGLSQLACWGLFYYLIGAFGEDIAAGLGWSRPLVYGGFSASLLVMGLASPLAGRLIDRLGGRAVMTAGSVTGAAGCAVLAMARDPVTYYAAWLLLGIAMRLTLYDAAFATLARIGGVHARRPMAQITLLGGLASTVFWPFGTALAGALGWRGALFAYAAIALLTVPLHLALPGAGTAFAATGAAEEPAPPLPERHAQTLAAALYALIMALVSILNSAMSAHMIGMLTGLGVAASAAVWLSTLRGIGQTSARFCEVLFGARLPALHLNMLAAVILPACFVAGLFSGQILAAAAAFALLYGSGNGLFTITRGTLPLVLFDARVYGSVVGRLLVPSFLLSAAGPILYASVIERLGVPAALCLSIATTTVILAASLVLRLRFGGRRRP